MANYVADATYGRWIFEVKRRLKDVRTLRDALQTAALVAYSDPACESVLILDEPCLTSNRIWEEWELFTRILDPELRKRIHIVEEIKGFGSSEVAGFFSDEIGDWRQIVNQILRHEDTAPPPSRPSAWSDVLRVLMVHWVRKDGPVASKQLVEETGFSYPTIASALDRLSKYLLRGANRSVGLQRFPLDEWQKLLVNADEVRHTRRYTVEGRPRSAESMVSRLRELNASDIAVGGILGARYWFPGIDLIGTPRLDLTVNFSMPPDRNWPRNSTSPAYDFIRKLDPALRPANSYEPAVVVVHSLFTPTTFFKKGSEGTVWANEAECLLDLQEARLEAQAQEFINHLTPPS